MTAEAPRGPIMLHVGGCGREHVFGSECPTDPPEGAEAAALEHDVTTIGDLARGVRVIMSYDGSTREEPAW